MNQEEITLDDESQNDKLWLEFRLEALDEKIAIIEAELKRLQAQRNYLVNGIAPDDAPIELLGLSHRVEFSAKRSGIETIAQLEQALLSAEQGMFKFRDGGVKTLAEFRNALQVRKGDQ